MTDTIYPATAADIPDLGRIAEEAGLFPGDLRPGMIAPALAGGPDLWLAARRGGAVAGFCFVEPERLTEGTWNMLALAVQPGKQKSGIGRALVAAAEERLAAAGGRILIVETAGADEYAGARAFYAAMGYVAQARLPDFYADGVDKVIFWKRLECG
jgi:ribosomal protein S18 acetylase RimI-like enzyme